MAFSPGNSGAPLKGLGAGGKEKDPFGPDILHNLFDQVEETAIGLPAGAWYIGKTAFGDVKNIFDGGNEEFKFDDMAKDIAKTTWDGMRFRWQPLVEGDFATWWDHVEEDPLGTILDVATVATLGGGAAASAGVQGVKAGGKAGTLSKMAGLKKTDTTLDDRAAGRVERDAAVGKVTSFDDALALERPSVEASFAGRGVVGADGAIWEGPKGKLKTGDLDVDIPLAHNPVIRARQRAGIAFANQFPNAKFVGANSRGARRLSQEAKRKTTRETLIATQAADKAIDALNERERAAVELANFRQQGLEREDLRNHWQQKLDEAEVEAAGIRKGIEEKGDTATVPKASKQLRVQTIKERLAKLDDDELWDMADEAAWANFPRIATAMNEITKVSRQTTDEIHSLLNPKREDGEDISADEFWEMQRQREAKHILESDDDLDDAGTSAPIEAESAAKDAGGTSEWIYAADLAAKATPKRKVGEYAHVRPHMLYKEFSKHQPLDGGRSRNLDPSKPNRAKHNKMLLFDDAFDILDPRTITRAAKQVAQYKAARQRMQTVLDTGRHVSTMADVPKGWSVIDGDKVIEFMGNAQRWLDEDARITFGETDELMDAKQLVDDLAQQLSGGAFAVPNAMKREFMDETNKVGDFIKRYDQATNVWRHFALSLRPAWITGNFFGQLALLLTTHGLIKGSLAYFQAFRMAMPGQKMPMDQMVAPDLAGSGIVGMALRDMQEMTGKGDSKASKQARTLAGETAIKIKDTGSSIWSVTEKINQLNAWLTDDIPRRAAFLAEIKPHVKRIQRETGMPFEEAALRWLEDPNVVDGLAEKVMDDLINFRALSQTEKTTLRRLMPFWSWIRGATGRTMRLAMDEPWKAWVGNEIAQYGVEKNEEIFGEFPDYLKGAIAIGDGDEEGNQRIIPTNTLNPFATAGDVAGIVKSLALGDIQVGGSNPMSVANPFIKAPIETFTNRDLFYGTPVDKENDMSYLATLGERVYHSFPQTRAGEKIAAANDDLGYVPMYEQSLADTLLGYLGVPTKQLNTGIANERAQAQREGRNAALI